MLRGEASSVNAVAESGTGLAGAGACTGVLRALRAPSRIRVLPILPGRRTATPVRARRSGSDPRLPAPLARSQRAQHAWLKAGRGPTLGPYDLAKLKGMLLTACSQEERHRNRVGSTVLRNDWAGLEMLRQKSLKKGVGGILIRAVASHRDRDPIPGVTQVPVPSLVDVLRSVGHPIPRLHEQARPQRRQVAQGRSPRHFAREHRKPARARDAPSHGQHHDQTGQRARHVSRHRPVARCSCCSGSFRYIA